jgi:hypothetical protein
VALGVALVALIAFSVVTATTYQARLAQENRVLLATGLRQGGGKATEVLFRQSRMRDTRRRLSSLLDLHPGLSEDFAQQNSGPLEKELGAVSLVAAARDGQRQDLGTPTEATFPALIQAHPDAVGVYQFSHVGFSRDGLHAVVIVWASAPGAMDVEGYALDQADGRWSVRARVAMLQSP